jgi:hypothetical protein
MRNAADLTMDPGQEVLKLVDWESNGPNELVAVSAPNFKESARDLVGTLFNTVKTRFPQERHPSIEQALYLLIHDYIMVQVCEQVLISHIHDETAKILPPDVKNEFVELLGNYAKTMR